MKNKKYDFDLLISDANYLKNAIKGLDSFVDSNISSENVKVEDLSALSGLLASIKLLAIKHVEEMELFSTGGDYIE